MRVTVKNDWATVADVDDEGDENDWRSVTNNRSEVEDSVKGQFVSQRVRVARTGPARWLRLLK